MLVRQLLNSQWNSFLNNSIFLATLDSTNNSRELYETLLYTGPPERAVCGVRTKWSARSSSPCGLAHLGGPGGALEFG